MLNIIRCVRSTLFATVIIVGVAIGVSAQNGSATYRETRSLLVKLETSHANPTFTKLFNEGDKRRADLEDLLYDPDKSVSLNAQIVFQYMADPLSLGAVERWYSYRREHQLEYWIPAMTTCTETKYLTGEDQNLAELVLRNLYKDDDDVHAKLIGNNHSIKTAVVELVFGQVFTTGWHVVIRNENGRWRLVSETLIWES